MYQFVLYVHLGTLAITVVGILIADHYGLSWVRGKREALDLKQLTRLHRFVGTGLVLMILSGGYLFWQQRDYLLHEPLFLAKMAFVALLVGNSFVVGRLSTIATEQPFRDLEVRSRLLFILSGAASASGWIGAFMLARLLFS